MKYGQKFELKIPLMNGEDVAGYANVKYTGADLTGREDWEWRVDSVEIDGMNTMQLLQYIGKCWSDSDLFYDIEMKCFDHLLANYEYDDEWQIQARNEWLWKQSHPNGLTATEKSIAMASVFGL